MRTDTVRRTILLAIPGALVARWASSQSEATISVVMRRFVFIPDTLTVQAGRPVAIRITSPEVPMGFSVPDFHARTDVAPEREAVLRITPDRTGSFTFVCDVFCGSGHENMQGTLVVRA